MNSPCPSLEDLLALLDSGPSGPRWDHVRSCPRCRSRLAGYRLFADPPEGKEARPGEEPAVSRLSRHLEDRILRDIPADPERRARETSAPIRPPHPARILRWKRWLAILTPAVGAAAVLVGTLLYVREELPLWRTRERILRGAAGVESPFASGANLHALSARQRADGGLELLWNRAPGADSYRLEFLDAGFHETGRLSTSADTMAILTPDKLQGLRAAGALYWRVEGISQGDQVAESAPSPLRPARRDGSDRSSESSPHGL
jgi:hypothetical protein